MEFSMAFPDVLIQLFLALFLSIHSIGSLMQRRNIYIMHA
jgi:hypothetical protein